MFFFSLLVRGGHECRCETVIRATEKRDKEERNKQGNQKKKHTHTHTHTHTQADRKCPDPPRMSQEVVPLLSGFYFAGFPPGRLFN